MPSEVARAALSAVTERWELMVLDPGGPTTVLVPRPAVWALAQQQEWQPAVVTTGGVDAVDPSSGSGVYRPIMIGPALLATLDQQNRQRFLAEWKASMERD